MGVLRLSIDPGNERPPLAYLAATDPDDASRRVIYVHGTPGSSGAWRAFLRQPPPGTESIAIDRPGFGRSGPRGPVVSFEEQAAVLRPLLDSPDGDRPILVGHSLGGPIIARAAADYPDQVAGLILVSASLDPQFENVGLMQGLASTPPVRGVLPRALRNSLVELLAGREQTEALAEVLHRVRCPVIIIHGTRDRLVPYANVEYMQRTLTGAASVEVVALDRANHFLPWTHEQTIREAIERLDAMADARNR
ncbi:MAG: alpha/beta hydrolase [Phycisphaerales bacterium]